MATPTPSLPTVVLVHGAWADGSSWRLVIPYLLQSGIAVVAVQNPTTSLAADVEATKLVLDAIVGPVVLVGHSWGGAVITQAGNDAKVKALVFVAALPPKAGESVGDLVGSHPSPPGLSQIVKAGPGLLKLSPEGWVNDVAQDLPEADARVLAVVQPPLPESTFGDKITEAAWETRPNWYIVSANDRVVSIELQRELAARLKATTSELEASHLSILSQPRAVAEVIISAVTAVSTS
ncbi:alpha/beta hydrolase [Rhodopseudomonas sp. HC1]|uniref:alpha/beta fold hydrolase n=1 Tax=Rhodopseudomonas infernalis TaxID=2897386 RepID=UPI001EE97B66|nr:alpha/beta hydrolase [Rhodopseudomonas infernalis]MCG6206387.1 alpha/beta hydrolase [Rhodopseudomonas infernalis]